MVMIAAVRPSVTLFYVVFKQDELEVVQRQVFRREGQAVGTEAADKEDHDGGQYDGERDIGEAEEHQRVLETAELQLHRAEALAADDLVVAGAENLALRPDDAGRADDQYGGQHGARADGLEGAARLVDSFVDQHRNVVDAVLDAEHGDGAEMGH